MGAAVASAILCAATAGCSDEPARQSLDLVRSCTHVVYFRPSDYFYEGSEQIEAPTAPRPLPARGLRVAQTQRGSAGAETPGATDPLHPESVAIVGDFNGWDPSADPMLDDDGNGVFTTTVSLPAGNHLYRIFADGVLYLDIYNPMTLYDAAFVEQSVAMMPDCGVPALEVLAMTVGDRAGENVGGSGTLEASVRFLSATSRAFIDVASVHARVDAGAEVTPVVDQARGRIEVKLTGVPRGKHWLTLTAADTEGVSAEPFRVPFWIEAQPFDWRDAIIYQIVIDRFRKGDGGTIAEDLPLTFYRGGDIKGVIEAIEEGYFEALGVNVLWVSPLYDNPDDTVVGRVGRESQAYHGYWPAQPRAVEEKWGGEAMVDALVAAAHAHGLRVIMDTVLNHVHISSPYVTEHPAEQWLNHPEGDCICGAEDCRWGEHMLDCWFDPFLPDLRFENWEVVDQLTSDALWWSERFNLDGLRLDAVPMMPRLVMRHLRKRVHDRFEVGGTAFYLVGENYTSRGSQPLLRYYLGPHTLNGEFDYPVMWALRDALAGRDTFMALDDEVRASEEAYAGSGSVMAPIIGNHDVGRFISDINGDNMWAPFDDPPAEPTSDKPYDLMKVGWAFLLSQPGAPVMYYGDEIALFGATDPDDRHNMRFAPSLNERQAAMLAHVQRLGRARACSSALRRGARETLIVNDNLYVYGRDASDGMPAVVVLNEAPVARSFDVELPEEWALAPDAGFTDVLGKGLVTTMARTLSIQIAPRSAALLLSQQSCIEEGVP